MKPEHKQLLKDYSEESREYFEVKETKNLTLLEDVYRAMEGHPLLLTINKRSYLLEYGTYDYVGYQKVTFTNISKIRTANLHDI